MEEILMNTKKRGGFTGSLGFVLAAAGSAVGVGNIWRFPYLAAKDGGGLFLIVYLVLVIDLRIYPSCDGCGYRTADKNAMRFMLLGPCIRNGNFSDMSRLLFLC